MISETKISENKQTFYTILKDNVHREGIDELIKYLEQSDFFIAPCSTKFHLACRGGLCQHSLNVYSALIKLSESFGINIVENIETITIISLLHDLCKVNFYSEELKPVKKNNQWVHEKAYVVDDLFPCGHGEKSVIRILQYMKLTTEEILAIRWHMGAWDNAVKGGDFSINTAQDKSKFVALLHCADMIASQIIEK